MDGQQTKSELQRHLEGAGNAIDEGPGRSGSSDDLARKVRQASDRVSEAAGGVYDEARGFARAARREGPEGGFSVSATIEVHPLASLLMAGAVGYAIGWMLHGGPRPVRGEPLPDYARKWR